MDTELPMGARLRKTWDMTLGRLLIFALIGPIRFYQQWISPRFGPTCRYHPSCSAYALGAIGGHGPLKGALLALWRLLRCNPWAAGGIDHVPEVGRWRGGQEVRVSHIELGDS